MTLAGQAPAGQGVAVRWAIDPLDERTVCQVSPLTAGDIVCRAPEDIFEISRASWAERAPLIAAAPALLEALRDLLHEDGGSLAHAASHPKCIAARAALSRATGSQP